MDDKMKSILPVLLAAVAGYPATKGTAGATSTASSGEEAATATAAAAAEPKKEKKKNRTRRVGAGQARFYHKMDQLFGGDLDKAAKQQLAELSHREGDQGSRDDGVKEEEEEEEKDQK
ncbi:uncharacterized protein PG986_014811 [Apiospora aurea]|uniref:Uncharacterized protein n=1 Tax=Apiospora aurea TaxID=335848 RepID=A0ABR1PUD6_9PEZI